MPDQSAYPHLLDSEYPEEPILSKLHETTDEIEKEFQFLKLVFHIGSIGGWDPYQLNNHDGLRDFR